MRKLLTLALAGLFSAAIVGCEASAEIDDDNGDVDYKKTTYDRDDDGMKKTTTVRESDGDTYKKVETRETD